MLFLFPIIIFISNSDKALSENETLGENSATINNIMTSKITADTSRINDSAIIDYLYDNDGNQDLDISAFEPEELKLLLANAQYKGEMMEREFNKSRRYSELYEENSYFRTKFMDYMTHSVYGTRYRLKDTKYIRKHFANDPAYNIAILYGALMQLRIKMDNLYRTLYNFNNEIKFLWHIVLLERCVTLTVDANYMVTRIFALKQEFFENRGNEDIYQETNRAQHNESNVPNNMQHHDNDSKNPEDTHYENQSNNMTTSSK